MNDWLRNVIALSILPQVILVKWFGFHPEIVEEYYSHGLYPFISKFFRVLFGWIPFSVGDILYVILPLLAIRYLVVKRIYIRQFPFVFLRNILMVLSVAYATFHLLWGLNYYRQPLFQALNLKEHTTQEELISFTETLILHTNNLQFEITNDSTQRIKIPYSRKEIIRKTVSGYQALAERVPILEYRYPSIKKSLFSTALTYMGYGGYFNPFTHEGQVNARLPRFRFGVVSGHEIGHQIGYSAENETNFIGYLVTQTNPDRYFKYAASAYALSYCLGEIQRRDEGAFELLYADIHTGVRSNFEEMNDFWMSFENPMEPVFKSIFNSFLKANNQADGIQSYNHIVSLMVAYHKEYPLQ